MKMGDKRRSIEEISKEIQENNHRKPTKEQIKELIDIINDPKRFDKSIEEMKKMIESTKEPN
jgi:hypothetical protein